MAQVRLRLRDAVEGNFPAVCARCGEEATTTATKKMQWCPPWVGVLILAGLLPYAIVASILTKRAKVEVPFCEQHKGHWFNRSVILWGSFLLISILIAPAMIVGLNLDQRMQETVMPFVCIGSVVLGLGWLVILIICQNTAIRPNEITDKEIEIKGVSEEFAEAVEVENEERLARRRKRRQQEWDEEEEEEPAPRKKRKRPPEDSFEE